MYKKCDYLIQKITTFFLSNIRKTRIKIKRTEKKKIMNQEVISIYYKNVDSKKKKVVYRTVLKNNNTKKKYYVYMYLYLALQLLICFLLSYNAMKIICYRKRKKNI